MDFMDGCVIFDTETTGLDVEKDDFVQLGCVIFSEANPNYRMSASWLANPGIPIPDAATAVHGITADVVKDTVSSEIMAKAWWEAHQHHAVFAGHNIRAYDMPLLAKHIDWPEDLPIIDTLQLAQRLEPHSPDHKLESLHRARFGNIPGLDAHDALNDCKMTFDLLQHYQQHLRQSLKDIATWLNQPILLPVMPFGKHKGENPADIPLHYAKFMLKKQLSPDVRYTLLHRVHGT